MVIIKATNSSYKSIQDSSFTHTSANAKGTFQHTNLPGDPWRHSCICTFKTSLFTGKQWFINNKDACQKFWHNTIIVVFPDVLTRLTGESSGHGCLTAVISFILGFTLLSKNNHWQGSMFNKHININADRQLVREHMRFSQEVLTSSQKLRLTSVSVSQH